MHKKTYKVTVVPEDGFDSFVVVVVVVDITSGYS